MKDKNIKNPHRKPIYVVALVVVLVALGVVYFTANQLKTDYTTLYEDVNNKCSKDGVTTLVSQRLVELQVPRDEVDIYIKNANEHGRCIYKNDE